MAKQEIVKSLAEKIDKVLLENERLEKHNAEMESRLAKLKVDNRDLREKLDAAQRRVALLELGEGLGGADNSASRKRARAQINRLMREIDRCIALMNN